MTTRVNARLVLVRHGETEWSRSGRHTGRSDIPLTDLGRRQADRLGVALAGADFSTVLSSPLARARETGERAGFAASLEVCPDLMEWDYGRYEGRSTDEIRAELPHWSVWTDPISGGETIEAVGARADAVISRLLADGGDAVLFAHGHLLRILTARWLGLEATAGALFALDTAAISTLGFERSTRVMTRWNDTRAASRGRTLGESPHAGPTHS